MQDGKCLLHVIYMALGDMVLDQHIINIDLHVAANLLFENLVHQSLVSRSCTL